jgi:hypothetical protein
MHDHGFSVFPFNFWKGESMSTRVPAIMLVLIVIAANQPAVILHKIIVAVMVLLKCLFG